jgi:riboflavin kinase/FMN adenylyltransferase
MDIIESIADFESFPPGWALTIGNFDGVHLGHQQIITLAADNRKQRNLPGLALMTFHPHPLAVLHPRHAPEILTPMPLKRHLLRTAGIDRLILIKDTFSLLNLSPKDFIDEFLVRSIKPALVVEGPDFKFGYGRSGDIDALRRFGALRDFDVVIAPPKQISLASGDTKICSSSAIRDLLRSGEVSSAYAMLGRNYRLIGTTIPGRGIGRQLGFPTANIEPLEQMVPAEGVYAGLVAIADDPDSAAAQTKSKPAAFSIGRAKTFLSDHPLLIEAHILNENLPDLTGKWLAMDFVQRIRPQQRFDSRQALQQQITADCRAAAQILEA